MEYTRFRKAFDYKQRLKDMKEILKKWKSFFASLQIPKKGLAIWCASAAVLLMAVILLLCLSGNRPTVYPVQIHEILASNSAFPNREGRLCDYIELHNTADYPVDLTGFQLGDIAGSNRYAFPYGTVLEAGGYLTVFCDKEAGEGYAPFGISRSGGESFYLITSGNAIADSVVTLATDMDEAMLRLPNGQWTLGTPTPNAPNEAAVDITRNVYNSGVSPVRISEFSAVESLYREGMLCDWVELWNTSSENADISGYILTDNAGNDKFSIPQGTILPANGYYVIPCAEGGSESIAPFGLTQAGGEGLTLKDSQGNIIELVITLPMERGSMALTGDSWSLTDYPSPGFANTQQGHEKALADLGAAPGKILISEIMAAEQTVLPDSFGDFSDWAELHNTGSAPVNLAGWALSDDPAQPQKWIFPELVLEPGGYTIVRCSGRDLTANGEIHTGFSLSAGGESLILSSPLLTTVDSVTFGATNAGYSLDCTGPEPVICSAPTPGYPNTEEGLEAFCASREPMGKLAIWEVMTANDWYLPQELGVCYDWVELRNISGETLDLSGYSITDDPAHPQLYRLQGSLAPGKALIIILSGEEGLSNDSYAHAGFSLNAAADQILLYDPNGNLIDYTALQNIPLGYSYGRNENIGGFFHMVPTPGYDNQAGTRQVSTEPTSSVAPGVYTTEESYTVPFEAAGTVYYTLDGTDPDRSSRVYSEPIRITRTTVLRAVSIEEGKLPSEIYTATFIIGSDHEIPVVSLVTDPGNLWGPDGIYKSGNIDIKEEKRPANFSYTGEDGAFSLDCEISLHGATTVTAFDKKSFSLRFQDGYDGPLRYDLFEDGKVTAFKSLILRTAHESSVSSHMHDALMGYIATYHCPSLPAQNYKYAALYINGEYWGLYALRELHSEQHYASHMNVPAEAVTVQKYWIDGNNSLNDLLKMCKTSFDRDAIYAKAKKTVDLYSFADWIIMESYCGNLDINMNMRYYYSAVDGLWRCGLVDVDLGFNSGQAFEEVYMVFHHGWIVRALMNHPEFQDLIAKRLAELLSGPMSDENMIAKINEMADSIRPEIAAEGERWGYQTVTWEVFVQQMLDYCDGRSLEMINSLCELLHFTDAQRQAYFGDLL